MTYTPVTVELNNFPFDGTSESPDGVVWEWVSFDGWFDSTDQRFEPHEVALGSSVTVDRRNGRSMTLTAFCHALGDGIRLDDLLYAGQKALKAAVSPAVDIPVLLQVNEPDVVLLCYVRQNGPIRSRVWGTRNGCLFQIPLFAPDPRRYAFTVSTVDLTSGTDTITNAGDLPAPPIFTITGGGTNPQVRNTTIEGSPQIVYGGTLGGGDTLVIDVNAQTVLLNGVDARANLTIAHWWSLAPGDNAIFVNADTNVVYRDAYS